MDISPGASAAMGPPVHSSPELEHAPGNSNGGYMDAAHVTNGSTGHALSAAAATSSQQPKVVQTAFIHKLYK